MDNLDNILNQIKVETDDEIEKGRVFATGINIIAKQPEDSSKASCFRFFG